MSKHRKITQNRRMMYSLAAGAALVAAGTGGVASAATPTPVPAHQTHAATPVPVPAHHADAATPVPVHRAEAATSVHHTEPAAHARHAHVENAAHPISELSAAERANAVG